MNKMLGISLSTIGAISGIAGILTSPDNIRLMSFYGILFVISISFVVYIISLLSSKSNKSIGVDPQIIDASFTIRGADEDDIRWIARLQKSVYSKNDAVPLNVLLEWYEVFPNGFFVIVDHNNMRVGHLDILPIKESALKKYKDGELVETEIRGECLYSKQELDKITDLYIESLIVSPKNPKIRPFVLRELMRSVSYIFSKVGNESTIKRISAMAATRDGERILGHLGFQKISGAEERKDSHNMYEAKFDNFYSKIVKTYHRKSTGNISIDRGL